jgi:pimeloyl-ACP methyl ester carboxylesterase
MEREGVTEKQLIFLGYSIGTGPSSLMAGKLHPRALILIAPFRELPAVIGEMPWYRYLKGFVWHRFPVRENVRALRDSCLAVVHGVRDQLIPPRQAEDVFSAYTGGRGKFFLMKEADHVDVFDRAKEELAPFLDSCLYPINVSPER